jgi:hypothetical protein
MSDTIILTRGEFATYQRAVESAKNQIALLVRERDEARQREQIACATYDGQQQSYRELETLYQANQGRALAAEADAQALRTAALAYVTSATYEERARLRAELEVLATVEHPGVMLLAELAAARAYLAYVLETYPPTSATEAQLRAAYDANVKGF